MKTYMVINKETKKRYIVPEHQMLILTNKYHFKAVYMKETASRAVYSPLFNYNGSTDLIPGAYVNIPSLGGNITYKDVLNGVWKVLPDTNASKVLFSDKS